MPVLLHSLPRLSSSLEAYVKKCRCNSNKGDKISTYYLPRTRSCSRELRKVGGFTLEQMSQRWPVWRQEEEDTAGRQMVFWLEGCSGASVAGSSWDWDWWSAPPPAVEKPPMRLHRFLQYCCSGATGGALWQPAAAGGWRTQTGPGGGGGGAGASSCEQ